MMFSFLAVLYSSLETDRQPSFGGDAANVGEENNAATPRTAIETQLGSAIWSPFDLNSARTTISDNTNSNAATNGQSSHTRQHWFAARNHSSRSRTRSWTPHGTHPKEAAGRWVTRNKKVRTRTLWPRTAVPLVLWSGLMTQTNGPDSSHLANSPNNAFASFRSGVSKPSVNQP